ncbi:RNA polymerase sigma factor [Pedobacter changchengzhani]|uniref:RNA polymerase sigma factor n=1 Tax=Pedobacter changchengzhani TaxID=2529274 RepID=UPI001FB62226|nr:sigma-70 family RNA polymerase sigma factor [Pedobacter changchengzhani]
MERIEYSETGNELFDLLRQGDHRAFAKIYKLFWPQLYNAAYKRLPEREKCQDIIQNVFTDLWNRRATLDLKNPTAYLHTAVRFQVLKQISRSPKSRFFVQAFDTELISPLQTDAHLLAREAKSVIDLFIKALPRKRKEIFLLHYFDGLNTAKISVQLNVSQKTVQNQLTTASHALRLRLTQLFVLLIVVFLSFL